MTDDLLRFVVLGAPNVLVAVVALFWTARLIERMITAQEALVVQLLEMAKRNEILSSQNHKE